MENERPIILVVNDDGITAPGIRALMGVAAEFGDVIVVAPDSPQSAMGHAITISKPLRLEKIQLYPGVETYHCSGTPVDCVKLAVNQILHRKPDLCISGINHGLNNSINVIYSGTMSAAMEGAIEGIPSIGFSVDDHGMEADFQPCLPFVRMMLKRVLEHGLPEGVLLNVNFPRDPILGLKVCRQAKAKWKEEFDERHDPYQRKYYWLTGVFQLNDEGEDTDVWALNHHYGSVVPVQFDFTAHHAMAELNSWKLNENL
jgi:5'-nucleotidase